MTIALLVARPRPTPSGFVSHCTAIFRRMPASRRGVAEDAVTFPPIPRWQRVIELHGVSFPDQPSYPMPSNNITMEKPRPPRAVCSAGGPLAPCPYERLLRRAKEEDHRSPKAGHDQE